MWLPDALVAYAHAIHPLSAEVWHTLRPLFSRRTLAIREHFAVAGTRQRTVGLLEEGCVRAYYTTAGGKEYNKHFFIGPAIIGDYASLITGLPVELPQQALSDCVVWVAEYRAITELEPRLPELVQFHRRFAEAMYLEKERRELQIATQPAAERYADFRRRFPAIEDHLPQYEIAAYLGITPTQLSRIRARLNLGK